MIVKGKCNGNFYITIQSIHIVLQKRILVFVIDNIH